MTGAQKDIHRDAPDSLLCAVNCAVVVLLPYSGTDLARYDLRPRHLPGGQALRQPARPGCRTRAAGRANLLFARGDIAGFQAALTATIRGRRHKWSRIHDSLGGARYSPPLLVNVCRD